MNIKGTFEVKMTPLDISYESSDDLNMNRMSLEKTYKGELTGTSNGEMLSVISAEDNAGYVAIEQVSGTMMGKKGSFALQHFGTMTPVSEHLNLVIVPGSGRGELKGISGSMKISKKDDAHYYELDYSL